MRRQFITTLVLLLRSIISIGAANKCTDGSAVKDLIGFTLDGERVSNTKLEAVRWRRFEGLLAERGVRSLVGIADCGRLRGLRATRDIEAGETLTYLRDQAAVAAVSGRAGAVGQGGVGYKPIKCLCGHPGCRGFA